MMKSLTKVLFLLMTVTGFSQSITLTGKVTDRATGVPLEAATVYLSAVSDSTMIDYTITDKSGNFNLKISKIQKPVNLKASFMGFKDAQIRSESLTQDRDFGTIALTEQENTLGEVIITSEAPPVRIKNDTLEFNASSFKLRPDSNVEALLKQLPGVEIDTDGKITVNGKEVNQILVNGKPFFDKDGKVALQSLPAEIINKVQVTDTKTKKEEASGQASSSNNSSINLTIDEDKNKGFFGKFMGGYGSDERYESSLLMNYFKGDRKISLLASSNNINSTGFSMNEIFDSMGGGRNSSMFTSSDGSFGINGMRFGGSGGGITQSDMIGLNYADEWFKGFNASGSYFFNEADSRNVNRTRQINFLPEGDFLTESNSVSRSLNSAHNFNSDFEYEIDSTSTLGFNPKFSRSLSKYNRSSGEASYGANGEILNESDAIEDGDSDSNQFSNSLYWWKGFKQKGHSFTISFDNENSKQEGNDLSRSNSIFYNYGENEGDPLTTTVDNRNQRRFTRNIRDTYNAVAQYQRPLRDSLSMLLELSYDSNLSIDDRRTVDYDPGTGEYSQVNDLLTNYLTSGTKEWKPMIGISMNRSKLNGRVQLGTTMTRFENEMFYLGENVRFNRDYLLPSANAYISYRLTKSKNIYAYYNYNVSFPSPRQVLPVIDISNPLNTVVGNPDLDPSTSHYLYMNYRNYDYATKSGISFYAGGSYYNDQIVSYVTYDESRKRNTTYENIAGNYSGWFGGNWSKSKKVEAHSFKYGVGLSANIGRNQGYTDGELYDAKSVGLTPRANFTYDYGEVLTINPTYSLTFNETKYSNFITDEVSNVVHRFNLQTTTYWPKNLVFGNDFGYTYNSNIADGFKKDFYLWNTSLGYNFFGDKLLAKVKVYDLLNQNQSATRTITATYIRDEENTVLQRYVMFSLTYKLQKFAGKESRKREFFH